MTDDSTVPAGGFSTWLSGMQRALRGEGASDVPCGACTACCTSSQFVHIGPEEVDTLAHVPAALLFPAPRLPQGHVLLGYDENGHCPMLVDGGCSIYAHRPQTCRTYDCRIFPASGVEPADEEKAAISRQARRWRFDFPAEADDIRHDAVRAAATFVEERRRELPPEAVPANATQHAVLAVRIHNAFLGRDEETGRPVVVDPEPDAIRIRLSPRGAPRLTQGTPAESARLTWETAGWISLACAGCESRDATIPVCARPPGTRPVGATRHDTHQRRPDRRRRRS